MDRARIDHLTHQREREWAEMQAYMASRTCLMEYLTRALDDPDSRPCGRCAVCVGRPLLPENFDRRTLPHAQRFLRHSERVLEPKKQCPANAFPRYGWNRATIPAELRAQEGRVLARWAEIGWGELVKEGKEAGRFSDELVEAVVELIETRWPAATAIAWISCVPSLRHPNLVPDFTQRLAARLCLPFHNIVGKARETRPQKEMENRFHQCQNLDGAFEIHKGDADISGAGLLVDDVTDSGWTMAIISRLLLEEGSGEIFPLALASSFAQ